MKKMLALIPLAAIISACSPVKEQAINGEVKWVGEAKNVLARSDIGNNVPLKPYAQQGSTYAIGPVGGIKGEVMMWDSNPQMGMIKDNKPVVVVNEDGHATWLVSAQVKEWTTPVELSSTNLTYQQVDAAVEKIAAAKGIDTSKPFPFIIKGTLVKADLHITNYQHDGKPMTKEKIGSLKAKFKTSEQKGDILGFFGKGKNGIFISNPGNIHIHVKTSDGIFHIDDLILAKGASIVFPAQ